jgi:predicted transcriptional regulator
MSDAKQQQLRKNLEWWMDEIARGRLLTPETVIGMLRDVVVALREE